MQQARQTIHESHRFAGNAEKLRDYYAQWASRYNDDVQQEAYSGPEVTANLALLIAVSYLNNLPTRTRILDAGCGTGLVGLELRAKGFRLVDGFDLSSEMVDLARRTGVYRLLQAEVDLNDGTLGFDSAGYDIVVCCGVLTVGHVRPAALRKLAALARPGGFLVVSTRNSYLAGSDFETTSAELEEQGWLRLVMCLPDARYVAEEGAHYWVYQRSEM